MYFKGQKFLVAGLSRSGEASARFLLGRGARTFVYDDVRNEKINNIESELCSLGAKAVDAESLQDAIRECDVLVLSPGIPIDNPLPVAFRKQGKAIVGEEELGAMFLRATSVAVTGTNGKTTTVAMLADVFKAAGKNAVPCGNFGTPLLNFVEELGFDDVALIEISSFQLETLYSLRPHVAVITNITEDHLNRHYNMENYVFLKSKLVRGLRESEVAVLNYDDERVRALARLTRAKVIWFSATRQVDGAYVEDGAIYFNGEKYLNLQNMRLGGAHNVYNALAAVAVSAAFGLDRIKCAEAVCAFNGVKHRVQTVAEVGGVTYVDDSKGTNVDATIKAVESATRPTVILLGGKDKGYDYVPLFAALKNSKVVHAVLYGENRYLLFSAANAENFKAVSLCTDMSAAFHLASYLAKSGQSVLLSPASASFDEFASFEERGDKFAAMAQNLKNEAKAS